MKERISQNYGKLIKKGTDQISKGGPRNGNFEPKDFAQDTQQFLDMLGNARFGGEQTIMFHEKEIKEKLQTRQLPNEDETDDDKNTPTTNTNPVFFMEMSQLSDEDEERSSNFRYDLARFLGLPNPNTIIPSKITKSMPNFNRDGNKVDTDDDDQAIKEEERKRHKIDICDARYQPLREELMSISRNASLWFRNYFMIYGPKQGNVFISNYEHLHETFETKWMIDPCIERNKKKNT